jgi:CubicO group peptidase (beta-lactamase class C family)
MKNFKKLLKWTLIFLAIFFLVVSSGYSKGLITGTPEEVGMSAERLNRIDDLFTDFIEKQKIKGSVAMVARDGKVVYFKAFGEMDDGKPMQKDTIFRICSMSKPINAVAVMILWEKGLFLLNDPIAKYIPEFKDVQVIEKDDSEKGYKLVPAKRPITIRHLLSHTSGISYSFWGRPILAQMYLDAGVVDGISVTEGTIAEGVKKLATCPLLFHPGEGWEYGLNNDVLGYFVEVISGMPYDQFLKTTIFDPLEMEDTYFFLPPEKVSRQASVYEPNPAGGIQKLDRKVVARGLLSKTNSYIYDPFYSYQGPGTYFSGGGGLVSTAPDYMRFSMMLLNGGDLDGVRLLSPTTVELMTRNHIGKQGLWFVGPEFKYGLGFGVVKNRDATGSILSNGTFNWGGFYYTRFAINPEQKLIFMFFSQLHPYRHIIDLEQKYLTVTHQAIVD